MDDRRPSAKAAVAAATVAAVGMAIAAIASVAPSAPTNCHGTLPFPVLSFPLFHSCFALRAKWVRPTSPIHIIRTSLSLLGSLFRILKKIEKFNLFEKLYVKINDSSQF